MWFFNKNNNFFLEFSLISLIFFIILIFGIYVQIINFSYDREAQQIKKSFENYISHMKNIHIKESINILKNSKISSLSMPFAIITNKKELIYSNFHNKDLDINKILENLNFEFSEQLNPSFIYGKYLFLGFPFSYNNQIFFCILNLNNLIQYYANFTSFEGKIIAQLHGKEIIIFKSDNTSSFKFTKSFFLKNSNIKLKIFFSNELYLVTIPAIMLWIILFFIPISVLSIYINNKLKRKLETYQAELINKIQTLIEKIIDNNFEYNNIKELNTNSSSIKLFLDRIKTYLISKYTTTISDEEKDGSDNKEILKRTLSNISKNIQDILFIINIVLKDKKVISDIQKAVDKIIFEIDRVFEYLDLSKQKSSTFSFFNLKTLISDIYFKFESQCEEKGLKLNSSVLIDEEYIFFDENLVSAVLKELLDNSIKFTRKGFINLNLISTKDYINIEIENSGEIIKGEYMNNPYMGIGIGLNLIKKLLEKFDGVLEYNFSHSKGTVKISIPIHFNKIMNKISFIDLKNQYIESSQKIGIEKGVASKIFDKSIGELINYIEFLLNGGLFDSKFLENKIRNFEEMGLNQIGEILKYVRYKLLNGEKDVLYILYNQIKLYKK